MHIIDNIKELREKLSGRRKIGLKIGFVPTMGFLHEGHMSLVEKSKADNDITVVSIFVNPIQFGPNEDLDAYPRDLEKDADMLKNAEVDFLFYPSVYEMYPDNRVTTVSVSKITDRLCGASRPGHFDGVSTVVNKLFNIVQPDNAYFGMKDYQQLQVIKAMVRDLNMNLNVVGMPIIREADGLAKSSRNVYLKPEERKTALCLSKSFEIVEKLLAEGERDPKKIKDAVTDFINSHKDAKIDYVEVVDAEFVSPLEKIEKRFLVALAVQVGKARLIDNNVFEVK